MAKHTAIKKSPLYRVKVCFTLRPSKAYKSLGIESDITKGYGGEVSTVQHTGTGESIVLLSVIPELNNCPLQCAAHESVHAAWRILEIAGVKVDAHNHEALAYLVDWCFSEMKKLIETNNG